RALNLQTNNNYKTVEKPEALQQFYVASLAEIIELLVTEDEIKFETYEDNWSSRIDLLEKVSPVSADALFILAELRLQWAFVYLKFGHEFDAAWNVRQAYLKVQECKKKFPGFIPIKKTSGVLEVLLGSVPEKYQWVISMFGMEGSVEKGLQELESMMQAETDLSFETALVYYLTQGFILQETSRAANGLSGLIAHHPHQRLALFLGGCLAIKNSESEKALQYFNTLQENQQGLPIAYADYQTAEVYLHKGDYKSSVAHYQKFLSAYTGLNYVKDAHYKIAVCYWLQGKVKDAEKYFTKAKTAGNESTEADKYAARSLAENIHPNVKLSKIRYATDGGYYAEAKEIIASVTDHDLPSEKEKIEFIYRNARLYHKNNSPAEAKKSYEQTIAESGAANWYFAPNACLQLGYIFLEENNPKGARKYFEKALTYKKHEYKNSIDSKAKSALARLKK
ncbi:MAG TPA: tetratricopeptide repeat protein, partial [Cyclobacteriaceae bacterium]|nr:tetratricopeptide repeat protein [Cyclobacteriaceae bacterium]